jgi:putative SOS response-associated peptidase YedK
MCGRFVRNSPVSAVARRFRVQQTSSPVLAPSYNIAPSKEIIIVNDQGARQLVLCRWGFVPFWAKDLSIGDRMINARAETVATKPAFRSAFRKNRCLVVADGFYEWQKQGRKKYPFYIRLKSGRPFGFAGLYSAWTSPTGDRVCTCTIITTEANEVLKPIHDRMPVILPEEKEDLWLDPSLTEEAILLPLLTPYPAEEMEAFEVSTRVNSPSNDSQDNVKPV